MTRWVRVRQDGISMLTTRFFVLVFLLVSMAAWPREAASPSASEAIAARLKRDSARCKMHADLGACDDAIRWNPNDPALLVAFADALTRAQRPADAIRQYRRAAGLAPNMAGIAAKISAAQARLSSTRSSVAARRTVQPAPRAPVQPPVAPALVDRDPGRRYSNAAPETASH
jgi:cytochrome c-type biogenesis protein CcmH/NrfG